MRTFKKLTMTLALLIMAVGGAWATEETLLTTITPTAKEQANYSTANVATVSFSNLPSTDTSTYGSDYLANWGWWGYGWSATVNAAEGYTITKCIFYDDANRTATDSEAPFVVETTEEDKTPRINGTPIDGGNMWSKGIKKIEVYGYKSEPTEWSLTPDETGKNWTLDKMPASNIELQVEYFAESNLFLSKNALADKTNIAVKAGDLGVQFGNDGKSANTITEGTPMTVKYNGTKKVIGFKVAKAAAPAGKTVDLSTYSGDSYEVTEDVTFTGTTNNEIAILYKGEGYEVTLDNVNAPKCYISAGDGNDNYTVNVKLKGTSRLAGIYGLNTYINIGEAAAGGTVILFEESPLGGSGATITINGGTVKAKTSAFSVVNSSLEVNGGAVYLEAAEDEAAVAGSAEGSVTLYGWNGSAWETYSDHRYLSTDNSKAPSEWTW